MLNGGRRFIDYSYSLNSPTIQYDQFRAITMISEPVLQKKRKEYIVKTDLIRRVQKASMSSEIDWSNSTYVVKNGTVMPLEVEVQAYIKINNAEARPFNIILFLEPVEKTDDNPDGIGIVKWIDVAEHPFKEVVDSVK